MRRTVLTVAGALLVVVVAVAAVAAARGGDDPSAEVPVPTASSTAWLPRVKPETVVVDFLAGVRAGDCDRQERYVTAGLVDRVGGCTATRRSPHLRWSNVGASIDLARHTAQVTFEVSDVGTQEGRVFGLVVDGGRWRIDNFRAEITSTASPTTGASGGS